MSTFHFSKADTIENTVDEIINYLNWIMSRLDSKNIKRLDTSETTIVSSGGEISIDGSLIEVYDQTPTLRVKQGIDSLSQFVYSVLNDAGGETIGIDSNGNAVLTRGSYSTLNTSDTNYIKMDDTGLKCYEYVTAAYELNGLVISSDAWSDTHWYYQGVKYYGVEYDSVAGGVSLKNYNSLGTVDYEFLLSANGTTYPNGDWDFHNATIDNLITDTSATHDHGIPTGTVLSVSGGDTATFTSGGAHSHTVQSV